MVGTVRNGACAIGHLPRNENAAFAADSHASEAVIETRDNAARSLREWHWLGILHLGLSIVAHYGLAIFHLRLPMVIPGVKLDAVSGAPTDVLDVPELSWLAHGTGSHLDVFVVQGKRRLQCTMHNLGTPGGSLIHAGSVDVAVDALTVVAVDLLFAAEDAVEGLGAVWAPAAAMAAARETRAIRFMMRKFSNSILHGVYQAGFAAAGFHDQRINIPASSAVRGARCSMRTDSWGACAPSPTAPMPSSVGMPSAAVKLPSDPPPVDASSSAKPSSAASELRFSEEPHGSAAALHGRPVDAAGDGERAARVARL